MDLTKQIKSIFENAIYAPQATKDKHLFSSILCIEITSIGGGVEAKMHYTNVHVYCDDVLCLKIVPVKDQVQFDVVKQDSRLLPVLYAVLLHIKESGDCRSIELDEDDPDYDPNVK
tara:strand:- start:304 stop:651 length:348 start_codon:yes stop_codon:yes gene_type:complete